MRGAEAESGGTDDDLGAVASGEEEMRSIFFVIFVLPFSPALAEVGGGPTLEFIAYCSSGTFTESVQVFSPDRAPEQASGFYCVRLQDQAFEPIMGGARDAAGNRPPPWNPATKAMVMVDARKSTGKRELVLKVEVNQKIPVCRECDGGCWKFKEWKSVEKSFQIPQSTNLFIADIEDVVDSWGLMGIRVRAVILDGGEVIAEKSFQKDDWAWCA